ncbi:MAG TPA: metal-dependent hydrolase [Candidatus Acidoferrum sp.]|jgi:membrane-bound metal-dependent hydrolase YbcI (DUF457 family)
MDIGTHALASLAIARATIPGKPQRAGLIVILAGIFADIDSLSAYWGPAAYLRWHDAEVHSIAASLLIAALLTTAFHFSFAPESRNNSPSIPLLFSASLAATWLHLAMDVCQSNSLFLLWPFSTNRILFDWLPAIDPWIIAILVAAILLPELLHLVTSEIGTKSKKSRGRAAAITSLAIVLLLTAIRANFHSAIVAALQSRTYRGEFPRRVAAFPAALSLFSWNGVVETDSTFRLVALDATQSAHFDSESATTLFKPTPSLELDAARTTNAAKFFLEHARIPKASVVKTESGFRVQLLDLCYAATQQTRHAVFAVIDLDFSGNLRDDRLEWSDHADSN